MSEMSSVNLDPQDFVQPDVAADEAVSYYQQSLEYFKTELKEIAVSRAELVYLGTLKGESPAEHWTGAISPTKRLANGEVTQEELDHAVEMLLPCFVPVTKGAPKRCVDGRGIAGYDDKDPAWFGRALGPQTQGGVIGDAIGKRLSKGYEPGATILGDVQDYVKNGNSDYAAGAHVDNHGDDADSGCGQFAGLERKNDIHIEERAETATERLEYLYDKANLPFPEHHVEVLDSNAESIKDNELQYFADKSEVIAWLRRQNPEAVAELLDGHFEATATLNFDRGQTFHTDHYNALTNNNVHNFNLDVWNIMDEHSEEAFFVLADVMATLMDLTAGDLGVYAIIPKATEPKAA